MVEESKATELARNLGIVCQDKQYELTDGRRVTPQCVVVNVRVLVKDTEGKRFSVDSSQIVCA